MTKYFCDFCGTEITDDNKAVRQVAPAPPAWQPFARCKHCNEEIRLDHDGDWEDRETHLSCANGPNSDKPHHPVQPTLIDHLTAAVREADEMFQKVGGSSRHWARDCFLPSLEKHGVGIMPLPAAPRREGGSE